MRTHDQAVHDQFDPRAAAYLTSAVHAQGPDLLHAQNWSRAWADPRDSLLDVGCGAGHLSFALAPAFKRVVAVDPSPGMLTTVARAAAGRGLPQLEVQQGSAESLPFADSTFDWWPAGSVRITGAFWMRGFVRCAGCCGPVGTC